MPSYSDDRRTGIDRRMTDLEEKYATIIHRLDTIDDTLSDQNIAIAGLTTLRNQVEGVLNFLKFVGFAGLGTMGLFLLRYIVKDLGP